MLDNRLIVNFLADFPLKTLTKNTSVFQNGDSRDYICFLDSGLVREYSLSPDGEMFMINLYRPGTFFPIRMFRSGTRHQTFFETITPSVIRQVSINLWHQFLATHPEVMMDVMEEITDNLETFSRRMSLSAKSSVRRRLLIVISQLSDQLGQPVGQYGGLLVNYPLTHRELAAWAQTTRESASLEIKKLEKAGLIKFINRRLVVPDRDLLDQAAD